MNRCYKYRLYPTKKQIVVLSNSIDLCRNLYNTSLQHRRDVYTSTQKSVSYKQQANELPLIKIDFPEYGDIYSQVLQDVLKRVDKSYQAFFRRVKSKSDKPGFPRFKSKDRFNSFTYPQSGYKICNGNKRIYLSQVGDVKINLHREIPKGANIKICTIKREGKKWYCVLSFEVSNVNVAKKTVSNAVGIDLGLTDFAFLSNGSKIKNPKYLSKSEYKLKELQSQYSIKKTKDLKRRLSNLYRKITNQRADFLHKTSKALIGMYDLIAYEDLKIKQMVDNCVNNEDKIKQRLPKHIMDACWGKFIAMLIYKAEDAGTYAISVNPRGTSQKCSKCGTIVPKDLYQRTHSCPVCNISINRDHNSALNILVSGTDAFCKQAHLSLTDE